MSKRLFESAPLRDDAVAASKRRRACLLVNPVGGTLAKGDQSAQVTAIWTQLRAAGIWAEIVETRENEPPGDVARPGGGGGILDGNRLRR